MAFGSIGAIAYDVFANDKTATGTESASARFRKLGTIVGGAMTGIGAATLLAGDQVNSAYADIRIGTGATGEALEGLKEDFHAVYGAIPGEAAAVSGALAAMNTTTGASGELLQALTTNIMEVSRMLGEDGAGNAQAFGEAMKQWQIPTEEGITLMDQFFKITQDTGIGFGELTGALNAYGPVLQNAGFTAAESAELFGRLEGSGIAVSRVMPGLNSAFRKWAEEGINGRVALEGTIVAIMNAETEMEALTIATETFGAEGAQRMTTAVRNSTFELSSLGTMLEGTEGLIEKTAEGTLTLSDKFGMFKAKLTETLAPLEGVGAAMTVLGPIMIAATTIQWGKVVAVLAHTKAMFGLIPTYALLGGALTVATIQLKLATAAQWLMNTSLYACPLVWIVGAIAAVVTVLIVLEMKFGIVTKAVRLLSDGIHAIIGFFGNVVDAIRGVVVDTEKLTEANERLVEVQENVEEQERNVALAHELAAEAAEEVKDASARLAEAQLAVSESAREVETLTEAYEELKNAMDDVEDKTESLDDLERAERHAVIGLKEARAKYSEVLKEHSSSSLEAQKAALRIEDAEDRLDDTRKRITTTTEELSAADSVYTALLETNGVKSANNLKTRVDKMNDDHKIAFDLIHTRELGLAEAKDIQIARDEDVKMYSDVLDLRKRKAEEIAMEIKIIEEGEVKASESALGKISESVRTHVEEIATVLLSFLGPIAGVVYAFRHWDEIIAKVTNVKDRVVGVLDELRQYLPFSDAEKGPLSDLTESGKSFMKTFSAGIKSESANLASSTSATIAPIASAATPSGASGGNMYGSDTISIGNVSLSRDYDFPALMHDIETYQSAKRVQRGIRTI